MGFIKIMEENTMNKSINRIMRDLSQPFPENGLEWRAQTVGEYNGKPWARILAYITNRHLQQRLDDVVGINGWKNEFIPLPNSIGEGALCGLSLKIEGEWVIKYDGAENTSIEGVKGGISDSMKRAGIMFGIGRYIYSIESMYADCILDEVFKKLKHHERELYTKAQTKDRKLTFWWKPKKLDPKFLPQKYINPAIGKSIVSLAEETHTKLVDILDAYGVDNIRDLFVGEAGIITDVLLRKKKTLEDEKNEK